MEMLKIGVDLRAVFQMNEVCEGTYVKGVLFSFLQQLMKFNHQIIEIFIFSADNPSISPIVFESLSVHQLNIDQVIFTGGESLISYLQALEVEVYFSADEFMVAKAQAVGILAGVISNKIPISTLSIAFDQSHLELLFHYEIEIDQY
jgi:5'-nucleotidase